ncbi:MAG: hypothetical protein J1E57_04060 [Prevotella sp.]|nr:hypothetical protein [Prevotella sp.]
MTKIIVPNSAQLKIGDKSKTATSRSIERQDIIVYQKLFLFILFSTIKAYGQADV